MEKLELTTIKKDLPTELRSLRQILAQVNRAKQALDGAF